MRLYMLPMHLPLRLPLWLWLWLCHSRLHGPKCRDLNGSFWFLQLNLLQYIAFFVFVISDHFCCCQQGYDLSDGAFWDVLGFLCNRKMPQFHKGSTSSVVKPCVKEVSCLHAETSKWPSWLDPQKLWTPEILPASVLVIILSFGKVTRTCSMTGQGVAIFTLIGRFDFSCAASQM